MTTPRPVPVSVHAQNELTEAELLQKFSISPDHLPFLLSHFLSRTPTKPDVAVAIWGKPGVGKTSGVRTYSRENNYRLIVLHLQLYDPSDLKGIAIKMDDGTVRWVNSSYLPQQLIREFTVEPGNMSSYSVEYDWKYAEHIECELLDPSLDDKVVVEVVDPKGKVYVRLREGVSEPVKGLIRIKERALVFLDEISTANTDVQNAALSLVLDRRVGEYFLPDTSRIVAAGNTPDDGAFVNPISSALANRFVHLMMVPTLTSFLTYAMNRHYDPVVISFLSMYGAEYLFRFNAEKIEGGDYGFATPRMWEIYCQQYDPNLPEWSRDIITVSSLGVDTGTALIGFRREAALLPQPMDILTGKSYVWPRDADRGTCLMMVGILASRVKEIYDSQKEALDKAKDGQKPLYDKYPVVWKKAMDGMYGFLNKYMEPDPKIAGHYMLTNIAKIPFDVLFGDQFDKFSIDNSASIRVHAQAFRERV